MTQKPANDSYAELVQWNCKRFQCSNIACACKAYSLNFTSICNFANCENKAVEEENYSDDENYSDSEFSDYCCVLPCWIKHVFF